jgi:hypothetical protein
VLCAGARNAARPYLAPLRQEAAEGAHVLVVDVVDLFLTEVAVLPLLLPWIRRGFLFSCSCYGSNTPFMNYQG